MTSTTSKGQLGSGVVDVFLFLRIDFANLKGVFKYDSCNRHRKSTGSF